MSEIRREGNGEIPSTPNKPGSQISNQAKLRQLPMYKVILHNDEEQEMSYVVRTIMELTHLTKTEATQRMKEAHQKGLSTLLVTHKERAELYVDQFTSKKLTASIEPA